MADKHPDYHRMRRAIRPVEDVDTALNGLGVNAQAAIELALERAEEALKRMGSGTTTERNAALWLDGLIVGIRYTLEGLTPQLDTVLDPSVDGNQRHGSVE